MYELNTKKLNKTPKQKCVEIRKCLPNGTEDYIYICIHGTLVNICQGRVQLRSGGIYFSLCQRIRSFKTVPNICKSDF